MNLRDRLVELLEPCVADLGLVLWELEYLPRSNGALLRLYIDVPLLDLSLDAPSHVGKAAEDEATEDEAGNEVSQGGITVDDCERTSRAVSEVLDASDPIPGYYTLEVSSPGLDRVLRTREHFERFVGEPVRVEMAAAVNGRKRYSGRLIEVLAEGNEVVFAMVVDGQTVKLPLSNLRKARLAPELSQN